MKRPLCPNYPFTEEEAQRAYAAWGCNCGPTALAVMLQIQLEEAHQVLPEFDARRYTNPTMMAKALKALGVEFHERDDSECEGHTLTQYGLVRIQFEGPWTQPGSNPKWAYRQTHWVGAAEFKAIRDRESLVSQELIDGSLCWVFDINGGWRPQGQWERDVLPELAKMYPRATGGWHATHRWELEVES